MSKQKKTNKVVAISLGWYIGLLGISVLSIIVAEFILKPPHWKNIIGNVGYGVVGSTVVAFLIDYATTKRKNEFNKKSYAVLTKDLKNEIDALIWIRTTIDAAEPDNVNELDYSSWFRETFNPDPTITDVSRLPVLRSILNYPIELMQDYAKSLKDKSSLLADNQYLSDDFFYHLDKLLYNLRYVWDENHGFNYDYLIACIGQILEELSCLFPEYRTVFFEKWRSDEMKNKYGLNEGTSILLKIIKEIE